jgi:hypothetical protein
MATTVVDLIFSMGNLFLAFQFRTPVKDGFQKPYKSKKSL